MGGKSSGSTTQNNYRPLTSDELRMQKASADYAESIQPTAYNMVQQATKGFDTASQINPNYSQLYANQANATANNTTNANNLTNGLLPTAFNDNRNAQAKTYMQGAMGNLLGDMNSRV